MRRLDPQFWAGKRVLVTGHNGFKGSWLVLVLHRLGAQVMGISLPPENESLFAQANLRELVTEAHVDLRDRDATFKALQEMEPDIVIHFAAQSLVRWGFRDPVRTFETNVMGSVHLFESLRPKDELSLILTATTDKVYLNSERGVPFREGDRLGGEEPYSSSKAAVELAISAYRASYFDAKNVDMLVCRAGNVVGGGDWGAERLLPDVIRAVRDGHVLHVRNPAAVRPWEHVLDALAGYLLLVEDGFQGKINGQDPEDQAWNFGPSAGDAPVNVEAICTIIGEFWEGNFRWEKQQDIEDIHESTYLTLDAQKAHTRLGWVAAYSPRTAVQLSIEWYAAYLRGENARTLCNQQIDRHPAYPN